MSEPTSAAPSRAIDCPSARPDDDGARIYGVVIGDPARQRVAYLTEARPLTPELLALAGESKPTELFRIAAPCAHGACQHFTGGSCSLAQRVVALAPAVVAGLPACQIRRTCRWFFQEGKAACVRCPQIVTERRDPTALDWAISGQRADAVAVQSVV